MPEKTLFKQLPETAETGMTNPLVTDFLRVYSEYQQANSSKLQEKEFLEDDRDNVADTTDPRKTNMRTNQSIPHKLTYKTVKQLDLPTFKLVASEISPSDRAVVQSLFEDAMGKAGWRRVLTNKKNGAQKEAFSTGNSIIGFGSNDGSKYPATYWNANFAKCATNADATTLVNPGDERSTRKFVTIKEYPVSQAISAYPQIVGKVVKGALPAVADDGTTDQKLTDEQLLVATRDRIQLGFCYDLDYENENGEKGLYMIIAGNNAFPIKELSGKDFPWHDRDGNAELPYDQITGFARTKGFIDYGILQIAQKIGTMHRTLENMGITYTLSNSNPVRIVATSQSETEFAKGFNKAQKRGRDGKVPIMINKDGKEFGGISTLQTKPIIDEMNAILERLEKDLTQMGFNLNDIATDATKTLGALQLEVVASTELIKYLQKENAPSYERLIQMHLNFLVDRKKDDSDIKLISTAKIRTKNKDTIELKGVPAVDEQGKGVRDKLGNLKIARSYTLEDLKEMLREFEWKVEVSGGVVNNPVLEDQALRDLVATSDPTSKASMEARAMRAKRFGFNFEADDFAPQSGIQQQAQPEPVQSQPAFGTQGAGVL